MSIDVYFQATNNTNKTDRILPDVTWHLPQWSGDRMFEMVSAIVFKSKAKAIDASFLLEGFSVDYPFTVKGSSIVFEKTFPAYELSFHLDANLNNWLFKNNAGLVTEGKAFHSFQLASWLGEFMNEAADRVEGLSHYDLRLTHKSWSSDVLRGLARSLEAVLNKKLAIGRAFGGGPDEYLIEQVKDMIKCLDWHGNRGYEMYFA